MSYKVLITTSGIGSRLGEFTKYTNKSLLRIGNKPAISYIVESYPENTSYVITLGYFGKQVKDFLLLAYPERSFEFVTVERYEGEKSSLLYSLSHAKDVLQTPFVFHASDTIVLDPVPPPTKNWNGGFRGKGSSNYASFDVLGARVTSMYEKGNLMPDLLHIGLVGIHDYKLFWSIVDDVLIEKKYASSLGDVDVLMKMVQQVDFEGIVFNKWLDIGNVDRMNEAKAELDQGDVHVLDKLGESIFKVNGFIVKFFFDEVICKNRVLRNKMLTGIVPPIESYSDNFYRYPYVTGQLYATVANSSNFKEFLEWSKTTLWKPTTEISANKMRELCEDFYFSKTHKRLQEFYTSRGIIDKEEQINGISVPSVKVMLDSIDKNWLCSAVPAQFHGDFILDNILQVAKGQFQLVDWRQDFAGELTAGDLYYDLGKLAHNLVVNHEMVDDNYFSIKKGRDGKVELNIHRFQTLVECEQILFKWLRENDMDIKKVEVLQAIIWLNMSPLHHHPLDIFLYYLGKLQLFQVLNK
jgi:dTDP-glucose pyrophosphorylase/thiamine kinase-like enzyme